MKTFQRTLIYMTVTALLVACANTQGPVGSQQSAADSNPCSVGQSAAAGAAAVALITVLSGGRGRDAAKGAVVGAAVGAAVCFAINLQSRQTKTAAQAERDYIRTSSALPAEPVVTVYSSRLQKEVVQRGQPINVNSTLELVNGSRQKVSEVREELVVFSPDGTPFKTGSKSFSSNSAGRFENAFELKLPQGAPQGKYALKTNVYVNGKVVATRDLSTQVVWDGTTATLVASR